MWYGILLVCLLLVGAILLIWFARQSQLQIRQKVGLVIISLFALFGLCMTLIMTFDLISPHSFKVKLGHLMLSHFSESDDMIGRLTVQDKGDGLVVFPSNQERKMVAVYRDGQVWTAWLENGGLTPMADTVTKANLWYLLFGK